MTVVLAANISASRYTRRREARIAPPQNAAGAPVTRTVVRRPAVAGRVARAALRGRNLVTFRCHQVTRKRSGEPVGPPHEPGAPRFVAHHRHCINTQQVTSSIEPVGAIPLK
jgi:hypothetical protein